MSKLGCICGHIIADQTDSLPYKASFIRDVHRIQYSESCEIIADFMKFAAEGKRADWLKNFFYKEYPADTDNASVIFDILLRYEVEYESTLYQCENCGRIKIQVEDKNLFSSFLPEDEGCRNIFHNYKTGNGSEHK